MKTKNLSTTYKTLGKKEFIIIKTLKESNLNLFSAPQAAKVLDMEVKKLYPFLFTLKQKGWIKEIENGKYILLDIMGLPQASLFSVVTNMHWPSYISLLTALNYYGLTEKVSRVIYIITTKRKSPLKFDNTTVKFVRIKPNKFFGYVKVQDFLIAEKEKAIVDSLYFIRYVGIDEICKSLYNAKNEISLDKLIEYAEKMRNSSLLRRLGYLLDLLKFKVPEGLMTSKAKGYALLDPTGEKKGVYDKRWMLLVNRSKKELLEWRFT